ncbi:hypothetical protein [Actinomadura latina]|uniref:Uncharacterized protein n=1 Tax=Actinomadura latina TaxID=163603 RepID=A0A846ZA77_9ACTN|nr:hypothetical protein [Actinomadura latina]NKZ07435.1 hypothetical protein [Actinomadura latina]
MNALLTFQTGGMGEAKVIRASSGAETSASLDHVDDVSPNINGRIAARFHVSLISRVIPGQRLLHDQAESPVVMKIS